MPHSSGHRRFCSSADISSDWKTPIVYSETSSSEATADCYTTIGRTVWELQSVDMERRSRYASHASNGIGETVCLINPGQQAFAATSAPGYANRLDVRYRQIMAQGFTASPSAICAFFEARSSVRCNDHGSVRAVHGQRILICITRSS